VCIALFAEIWLFKGECKATLMRHLFIAQPLRRRPLWVNPCPCPSGQSAVLHGRASSPCNREALHEAPWLPRNSKPATRHLRHSKEPHPSNPSVQLYAKNAFNSVVKKTAARRVTQPIINNIALILNAALNSHLC